MMADKSSKSIVFVTFARLYQKDGVLTSDVASARYRIILPPQQLARRGHKVEAVEIPSGGWDLQAWEKAEIDTVVFSKSFNPNNEELAKFLIKIGTRIVFDVCDNHFDHPQYGKHFHAMCNLADELVASTERMAEIIRDKTGRVASVISDPLEGNKRDPVFSPRFPRLKLLWFGHPTNLDSLEQSIPGLVSLGNKVPLLLTIVTSVDNNFEQAVQMHNAKYGDALQVHLIQWSTDATWTALEETDLVIIPSLENDRKSVKSPNRLIESLWAGRFVIAHPMHGYMPYKAYSWMGENLNDGILYALNNPEEVAERISRGQKAIAGPHSAWEIGNKWENILTDVIDRPLRLNLGCGDKILPEYVNVDVVESRRGMRPDILCDLHSLTPFADNSADEILSVHVVEHFWRWEVRDILKEWVRVLKPGGKMLLECPNLESACREFLEDPGLRAREDQQGQRTMWVFYGDPAWKDPYMVHRWGYTPHSLGQLLAEVGLVDIRQEPAQFKLREPRDMRITGVKPG